MKVKVDSFLTAAALGGASKAAPVEAEIVGVRFIEKDDLPFPSEEGKYEITVSLEDDELNWMPNKTSLRAIVSAYGDESTAWEGKKVKLYSVMQMVSGKEKEIVYAVV